MILWLSGTVGEWTLTEAQMPSHGHTTDTPGTVNGYGGGSPYNGEAWGEYGIRDGWATGGAGGSQSHTHSFIGSASDQSSMPPFYALSYIMRLS